MLLGADGSAAMFKEIKSLKLLLVPIVHEVFTSQRSRLDVWTPSKVTRKENPKFKANLISFYGSNDDSTGKVKCMILNDYLNTETVIDSHIFKASTLGNGLESFGLKPVDVHNKRNGILLYEKIMLHIRSIQDRICFECS